LILAVAGWSWLPANLSAAAPPNSAPPREGKPHEHQKILEEKNGGAAQNISGRAFDRHGTPVAGAIVWLTRNDEEDLFVPVPNVIAETRSGVDGRFKLAMPPSEFKRQIRESDPAIELWIWKSGLAVGHSTFFGLPPAHCVSCCLRNELPITLVIKSPKGAPCNAASVSPAIAWFAYARAIPMPLRERLTARSDAEGRVKVLGFNGRLAAATVEKAEFGSQTFVLPEDLSSPITATLHETRDLEGRIVAPKGAKLDLSQVRMRYTVSSETWAKHEKEPSAQTDMPRVGTVFQKFSPQPDNQGRFKVPHILDHGIDHMRGRGPDNYPCVLATAVSASTEHDLHPGEGLKVEIVLSHAVWCSAVVQDSQSKHPLSAVAVAFVRKEPLDSDPKVEPGRSLPRAFELPDLTETDDRGHLRARVRPGGTYYVHCFLPAGYLRPLSGCETEIAIPAAVDKFELPPIELVRACTVQGSLLDAAGKPLAGVRIRGNWRDQTKDGKDSTTDAAHWTTTDPVGHFRFEEIGAGTNVALLPVRAGVPLCDAVKVVAGDDKPVQLNAKKEELVALSGRVLEPNHKPIPDAQVVIEVGDSPDPSSVVPITADANGCIRTPDQFPKRLKYRLTVRSLLDVVASSDWMCPAVAGTKFPDLVVDRAKSRLGVLLTGKETVARVNGRPIYATELLERAFVERLTPQKQTLYAAKFELADGRMTEREFRSLQEMAIKKFLSQFVRTRLLTQAYEASLDAEQKKAVETAVNKEFDNYVPKLERDFSVAGRDAVDHKLRDQGTSLVSLKAEFRYRTLSDEYLRANAPDSDLVWQRALAYYQSHRDAYATRPKVNWQLLEVNFDKARTVTSAVGDYANISKSEHNTQADSNWASKQAHTDSILSNSVFEGADKQSEKQNSTPEANPRRSQDRSQFSNRADEFRLVAQRERTNRTRGERLASIGCGNRGAH
jgi:hypothetical protein